MRTTQTPAAREWYAQTANARRRTSAYLAAYPIIRSAATCLAVLSSVATHSRNYAKTANIPALPPRTAVPAASGRAWAAPA